MERAGGLRLLGNVLGVGVSWQVGCQARDAREQEKLGGIKPPPFFLCQGSSPAWAETGEAGSVATP